MLANDRCGGRAGTFGIACLLLAMLLWFYWPGEKSTEPVAAQSTTGQQPAAAPTTATNSAAKVEIKEPERPVHTLPTHAPFQTSTNKMDPDEFVAETLKNPYRPVLPSTIPPLSDAQVDQLEVAYMQIAKPTEKSALLWALGFSQNDRAFDTLRYAMLNEYSAAALSTGDAVTQLQVVKLIGVLARTSDRAWQFLATLARPDAWGRINAWSEDHLTEQYESEERSIARVRSLLQGQVIQALSASGRPEFITWSNSLFDGRIDPATFDQQHAKSVSRGVFQATFIAEHGFDEFYDNVMYHARQGGFAYSRWMDSEEGQRWTKWWQDQVTQAITRDRANSEK